MSRALVISGGGSKGAFAIGVLKKLFMTYPGLQFDMLAGTSTGSLIVPMVALGEMKLLEQLYTTLRTEDIVLKNRLGDRLNDNSIFDASPLWNLLTSNYTDRRYNEVLLTGKQVLITTTCLQSGELVIFGTVPATTSKDYQVKQLVNGDQFRKAVMASASQPVFLPPVKVNKNVPGEPNPAFQFVDGGVKAYAALQAAIDNGATEIFVVVLSADEETVEPAEYTDLLTILEKTIDIFIDDVGRNNLAMPIQFNAALEYIGAVKANMLNSGVPAAQVEEYFTVQGSKFFPNKKPVKLFLIRPETALGGGYGGLEFDPEAMKAMLQKGEARAADFIASLHPGDISWG